MAQETCTFDDRNSDDGNKADDNFDRYDDNGNADSSGRGRDGLDNDKNSGGGGTDNIYLNVPEGGPVAKDLGAGGDVARMEAEKAGQVRLTFASADVGNGNAFDGNNAVNKDGGLAVRFGTKDGDILGSV